MEREGLQVKRGDKVYIEATVWVDFWPDRVTVYTDTPDKGVIVMQRNRIHTSTPGRIATVRAFVVDKLQQSDAYQHGSFQEGYSQACRDIVRWLDSWLRTGR